MSDKEVLEKAIKQAIKNGWKLSNGNTEFTNYDSFAVYQHDHPQAKDGNWNIMVWWTKELTWNEKMPIERFIYSHDFAKALWGEPWAFFTEGKSGDTLPSMNCINWKGHLANMVVADDPIDYLSKNIYP